MKPIALTLGLTLAAFAMPAPLEASPAMPEVEDFAPLAAPAQVFATPLDAAQHFARYAPETDEGAPSLDLTARLSDRTGEYVMVFSAEGYADDSVRGEQWRIVIARAESGWKVIEAGRRFKCWRGENTETWQTGLCP